jgi:hypothetical protein
MASRRQRDEWTDFVRRPAAILRGRVAGLVRWLLWGRTPALRETMSTDATEPRPAYPLTAGQTAVVVLVAACVGLAIAHTVATPMPPSNVTVDEVTLFLKQLYPDREVIADEPGIAMAPFAVWLHLIRSAEPAVARRAIEFAAEKRFGSAAPYVIGRLGSDDPELERVAQHFLRTIAGGDYGPDAASWRAWWRDPPKNVFGWSVGWTTLKIVVYGGIALAGLSLMLIGLWRSRRAGAAVGGAFLVVAYFLVFFELADALVGDRWTCTFGSARITYYSDQPIGLEDSRIGAGGLGLAMMAAWVLIPLVLAFVCHALVKEGRGPGGGNHNPLCDKEDDRTGTEQGPTIVTSPRRTSG